MDTTCTISQLLCGVPGAGDYDGKEQVDDESETEQTSPGQVMLRQPTQNAMKNKYSMMTSAIDIDNGRHLSQLLRSSSSDLQYVSNQFDMGQMEQTTENMNIRYERMVQTLSMSNSALLQEAESYRNRYHEMRDVMEEHYAHLTDIYHTLYASGVSSLRLPEGDTIDLSRYRGTRLEMLSLGKSDGGIAPKIAADQKMKKKNWNGAERDIVNDLLAERLSNMPNTDSDKAALQVAVLKVLTKAKGGDDLDDYVNWLHDSTAKFSTSLCSSNSPAHSLEETTDRAESPLLISIDDNTLSAVVQPVRKSSETGPDSNESASARSHRLAIKAPGANRNRAMSAFTLSRRQNSQTESKPRRSLASLKSSRTSLRNNRPNLI